MKLKGSLAYTPSLKGTMFPGGAVNSVNGQTGDVIITYEDVGALPDSTFIPSKTSDLTNDSGFLAVESDPTVPNWAKALAKPTYTASEVGAQEMLVSGENIRTVNGQSLLGSGDIPVGDPDAITSNEIDALFE